RGPSGTGPQTPPFATVAVHARAYRHSGGPKDALPRHGCLAEESQAAHLQVRRDHEYLYALRRPVLPEAVLRAIDVDELCSLAVDLCSIDSPPGFEADAARFVENWLKAQGISTRTAELSADRRSVLGRIRGSGN